MESTVQETHNGGTTTINISTHGLADVYLVIMLIAAVFCFHAAVSKLKSESAQPAPLFFQIYDQWMKNLWKAFKFVSLFFIVAYIIAIISGVALTGSRSVGL